MYIPENKTQCDESSEKRIDDLETVDTAKDGMKLIGPWSPCVRARTWIRSLLLQWTLSSTPIWKTAYLTAPKRASYRRSGVGQVWTWETYISMGVEKPLIDITFLGVRIFRCLFGPVFLTLQKSHGDKTLSGISSERIKRWNDKHCISYKFSKGSSPGAPTGRTKKYHKATYRFTTV